MDLFFGLPNLRVVKVTETLESILCTVELEGDPPVCPSCGIDRRWRYGWLSRRAWDTPARGKPMRLVIKRPRYRCRCGATYVQPGAIGISEHYPSMTLRLARYIQNAVLRQSLAQVAKDTGVSRTNVRLIAAALASRLYENHRFPTPEILGIDDLRIRKKLFTVVTDGLTGKPVALIEGGTEKAINKELARRRIDPAKVKVVVSDLGGSNIAVFKSMFKKHGAVHVADKWHVLKGVREALSLVINRRVDQLRRRRARCEKILKRRGYPPLRRWDATGYLKASQERIDQLVKAKRRLLGAKIRQVESTQRTFTFIVDRQAVTTVLGQHPAVSKAFWAKMRLHMVYTRQTRAEADAQIDRFVQRASSKSIAGQMKPIVERVKAHRQLILNYFDALGWTGKGPKSAPTTGPTERRNGIIKTAWKSARGLHDIKMFSMRALYEPWDLDVDIGVCSHDGCTEVEGPFSDRADRTKHIVLPCYSYYCQHHASSS